MFGLLHLHVYVDMPALAFTHYVLAARIARMPDVPRCEIHQVPILPSIYRNETKSHASVQCNTLKCTFTYLLAQRIALADKKSIYKSSPIPR